MIKALGHPLKAWELPMEFNNRSMYGLFVDSVDEKIGLAE